MKKILIITFALVLSASSLAEDTQLFVEMYQTKLKIAKVQVNIAKTELVYAEQSFNRGKALRAASSGAISERELDVLYANYKEKLAAVTKAEAAVGIDKSLLKVAIDKISLGMTPPICFQLN